MELALIDSAGEVHTITEDIEEYNLDKPMASATVINDIKRTIGYAIARQQAKGTSWHTHPHKPCSRAPERSTGQLE